VETSGQQTGKFEHPEGMPQPCDPGRVGSRPAPVPGGIAALNPRLLSRKPPACRSCPPENETIPSYNAANSEPRQSRNGPRVGPGLLSASSSAGSGRRTIVGRTPLHGGHAAPFASATQPGG
jgi:hypothetical protein